MTGTAVTGSSGAAAEPQPQGAPHTRALGWWYVVGGGIGLVAAFTLMLEKIATLVDPDYVPTCSINPVISCGSVMASDQAAAFGFPNPLLGIGAFAVVVTVGAVLLTGAGLPRWFWLGMLAGTTFGVAFVHWLIAASLYDLEALCPYCMVVWVVTIPLFWSTALHTLRRGDLGTAARTLGGDLARARWVVLTAWYLGIVALILQAFWSYWSTLV